MNEPISRCGKCQGAMEPGFGVDKDSGAVQPSRWVSGAPEHSWWQGIDAAGRDCRLIKMLRCTQCGFLESYALEPVAPPSLFKR